MDYSEYKEMEDRIESLKEENEILKSKIESKHLNSEELLWNVLNKMDKSLFLFTVFFGTWIGILLGAYISYKCKI